MLKQTPLYQEHVSLGAKIVPFAGWQMPVSYSSIIEEHNAVRNSVGMFDVSHMGLIKIEGDDALALLQKVGTNDASKLKVNQCQYTVLCNEHGGTVDDVLLYRLPMFYLIVCNASNTDKVLAWLNKSGLASLHQQAAMISVQGPKAREVVGQALNIDLISNFKRNQILWWRDIIMSHTGYTGEDGVELIIAKLEVVKIWQKLLDAGVKPCGLGARDTLRLEAGLPLYGHEYDEETSPLEVGYNWAVKFDKGDFIGRKALLKQKEAGLKKKLVGLSIDDRQIPRAGNAIYSSQLATGNSQQIGKVTSGTFSPSLKKPIAVGFVPAELDGKVSVEIRGKRFPAKIVAKTFYKR